MAVQSPRLLGPSGPVESDAMKLEALSLHAGADADAEAFLAERIYEFNAKATGYFDGEAFSATRRDELGAIVAGVCGYTWGRCCYVSYLWVDERVRFKGLGAELLDATERHALNQHCAVVFVGTHSFQAPRFYQRMGYEQQTVLHDHPVGHSSAIFAKRLPRV